MNYLTVDVIGPPHSHGPIGRHFALRLKPDNSPIGIYRSMVHNDMIHQNQMVDRERDWTSVYG